MKVQFNIIITQLKSQLSYINLGTCDDRDLIGAIILMFFDHLVTILT